MSFLYFVSELEPRPSLHYALDEVGVIARPNEILDLSLVFFHWLNQKVVRKSYSP